jgi:hypothetical protein
MKRLNLICAVVMAIASCHVVALARQVETTKTEAWRLTDITGKTHTPFGDAATKAMVLVFISTDCPIANSYHPLLRELAHANRANGIYWCMIHPDPATTAEQASEHGRRFQIDTPIVIDHDQAIARRAGDVTLKCLSTSPASTNRSTWPHRRLVRRHGKEKIGRDRHVG